MKYSFRMDEKLLEAAQKQAEAEGITMSQLMRAALLAYMFGSKR